MSFLGTYFALRLAQRHNRKSTERRFARRFQTTSRQRRVAAHRTTRDWLNGTWGQK